MIPVWLVPYLIRGASVLVIMLTLHAGYRHIHGAFVERDALKIQNATLTAQIEASKRAIKTSEANTLACEKDAQSVADLASQYIKDKRDVDAALSDALSRTQRVRIVTRVADASPLPGQASTSPAGDHAAGECGLSRTDKESMEEGLSGLRDETYGIAAQANKVVRQLGACQARIRQLEAAPTQGPQP